MVNGNGRNGRRQPPAEIRPEELALMEEQRKTKRIASPGQIDDLEQITEPPVSDVPPRFDTFEPPVSQSGILTGRDFSPKRTADRLQLPDTPAGAFEFFMNPPARQERSIPSRKRGRARLGGRARIPDRPDLGIRDSFGVEELFIQNDADARRLRRSFF